MKRMAIFLRGINVNGINMKMDELKCTIEAMNYANVKTILSTGNILVTTEKDEITFEEHKNIIEDGLSKHFGYDANIIIKSAEQINGIMEEVKYHQVPEGYHHYILLTNESSINEILLKHFDACNKAESEVLLIGKYGIYWIVPKGDTLKSDFGKVCLGSKKFKNLLTSRTINTIQRISKML